MAIYEMKIGDRCVPAAEKALRNGDGREKNFLFFFCIRVQVKTVEL